jgi:hypothetical protein
MEATLRPPATEPDDAGPAPEASAEHASASSLPAKSRRTTRVRTRDDINFDNAFDPSARFYLDTYWTQTPAQGGFR